MDRTGSWPWLNKFFERQTGDFTQDLERSGHGNWPDDFAKMGHYRGQEKTCHSSKTKGKYFQPKKHERQIKKNE
jgi:hypothetical protein